MNGVIGHETQLVGPPTTSLLSYLCADELLESHHVHRPYRRDYGEVVPCRDAAVTLGPLAGLLFAAAFWGLCQSGLLTLAHASRIGGGTGVKATGQADLAGLEGAILRQFTRPFPPEDVAGAVTAWFSGTSHEPCEAVVRAVVEEGVGRGYFTVVPRIVRGGEQFGVGGKIFAPQRAAITALQPQLADLQQRWPDPQQRRRQFPLDERILISGLRDQCCTAIEGRHTKPSTGALVGEAVFGPSRSDGRHGPGLLDLIVQLFGFLSRR